MRWCIRWVICWLTCLAASEASALTLADALDEARRHDPRLAAAGQEQEAATAALRGVRATWLPNLELRHRFTRLDDETLDRANVFFDAIGPLDSLALPPELDFSAFDLDGFRLFQDAHRTELELSWPLLTGGARWGALRAAGAGEELAAQRTRLTARLVELETRGAFLGALQSAAVERVMAANQARLEDYLETSRSRLRAGKGIELDLLRWQVALEQAGAERAAAQAELTKARAALARAIGRELEAEEGLEAIDVARDLPELEALEALLQAPETAGLAAWHERLRRDAPGVRAAEAAETVASGAVLSATSALLPSLALVGVTGWQANETMDLDGYREWNVSAVLSVPLLPFVGGYFQRAEAQARQAAQRYRIEDVRRGIKEDLVARVETLRAAATRRQHSQAAQQFAARALAAAERAFAAGLVGRLELEDARIAFLQAELATISAQNQYRLDAAALGFLLGYRELAEEGVR